jgi:3-deoxy-D-manno-octulosonic-acid transferase
MVFRFFYNCLLLLLYLIMAPETLWDHFYKKKKTPDLLHRLGIKKYPPLFSDSIEKTKLSTLNKKEKSFDEKEGRGQQKNTHPLGDLSEEIEEIERKQRLFIHAVSVGEVKAAILFIKRLLNKWKNSSIVLSVTTHTGYKEAQKLVKEDEFKEKNIELIFFPFDFSWVMKPFLEAIRPDKIFLIEGDLWLNFLYYAKKIHAQVYLISGKLSKTSLKRFKIFSFFSKKLFSLIDLFFVQNGLYKKRFLELGVPEKKVQITGNIKFDDQPKLLLPNEKENWKKIFHLGEHTLCIFSTHSGEEELFLDVLNSFWKKFPYVKVLLVPRHPERFPLVQTLLKKRNIPFGTFSIQDQINGEEKLLLIDTMGFLSTAFQLSDLAIGGGSFTNRIGGHNILEPIFFDVPVFFGPFMFSQEELKQVVLEGECGKLVSIEEIADRLLEYYSDSKEQKRMKENCEHVKKSFQGSIEKVFIAIEP